MDKSCGLETREGLPLATRVPLTYNFSCPVSLQVKAKLNQPVGRTGVLSFHCLFLVLNITMYLLEKCRTAKPRPLVDWPPLDMMYELVVFLRELWLSFSHDIKVIPLAAQSPWSLKQVSGFWNQFKSQSCETCSSKGHRLTLPLFQRYHCEILTVIPLSTSNLDTQCGF